MHETLPTHSGMREEFPLPPPISLTFPSSDFRLVLTLGPLAWFDVAFLGSAQPVSVLASSSCPRIRKLALVELITKWNAWS